MLTSRTANYRLDSTTPAFIFIFIAVLLDVTSMGIVVPVLPQLILGFMRGDFAKAADMLGIFISVWALMRFVVAPIIGGLSDHVGRRRVVFVSNLALALDHLLMAFAPVLWVLFVGRVLSGVCSATVSTAYAYIADIVAKPTSPGGAFSVELSQIF